jgi:chromosome segregation ATPase
MAQAGSATGTSAQRQADQAIAARVTRFEQRQKQLRGPVATYFRALAAIDKTRTEAERKATRLRTETEKKIAKLGEQAEQSAATHQQAADQAIAELADLGESPRAIAELLCATTAHVRAVLAARSTPTTTRGARDSAEA